MRACAGAVRTIVIDHCRLDPTVGEIMNLPALRRCRGCKGKDKCYRHENGGGPLRPAPHSQFFGSVCGVVAVAELSPKTSPVDPLRSVDP